MIMPDQKLTPEEYAEMMKENKPHLIELEERASKLEYGTMQVIFHVRAGAVNKMEFHSSQTWLAPKKT